MVVRDHKGELVVAGTKCRDGRVSLELAEALGIKEALSWVKYQSAQPVIIETNCLSMLQAIRCSTVNLSYLGRVIDECKALVKRSANSVAHLSATHDSSVADRKWSGNFVSQNSIKPCIKI